MKTKLMLSICICLSFMTACNQDVSKDVSKESSFSSNGELKNGKDSPSSELIINPKNMLPLGLKPEDIIDNLNRTGISQKSYTKISLSHNIRIFFHVKEPTKKAGEYYVIPIEPDIANAQLNFSFNRSDKELTLIEFMYIVGEEEPRNQVIIDTILNSIKNKTNNDSSQYDLSSLIQEHDKKVQNSNIDVTNNRQINGPMISSYKELKPYTLQYTTILENPKYSEPRRNIISIIKLK